MTVMTKTAVFLWKNISFLKKIFFLHCSFRFFFYLCTRKTKLVGWMRGLVNGLQNRQHPFESGTDLKQYKFHKAVYS